MTIPDPAMADNLTALVELKSCPFCGSKLVRTGRPDAWNYEHLVDEAEGCLLHNHICLQDADDIDAWNWRAPALLDALEASQPKEDAVGGGEAQQRTEIDCRIGSCQRHLRCMYTPCRRAPNAVGGIPAGMVASDGVESPPDDWDADQPVKYASGLIERVSPYSGNRIWRHVVAYTPKARPTASDGEARERIAREAAATVFDGFARKTRSTDVADLNRSYAKKIRAGEGDDFDAVQSALKALDLAALPTTDGVKCQRCGSDDVALYSPDLAICPACCTVHEYADQGAGEWICSTCGSPRPDDWSDGYDDLFLGDKL